MGNDLVKRLEEAVTPEQVEAAVAAAGIVRVDHHDCGGCGYMTAYLIRDGQLYFDPGCDCSSRYGGPEPRDWSSASDWINMQTDAKFRADLMQRFGLVPKGTGAGTPSADVKPTKAEG